MPTSPTGAGVTAAPAARSAAEGADVVLGHRRAPVLSILPVMGN